MVDDILGDESPLRPGFLAKCGGVEDPREADRPFLAGDIERRGHAVDLVRLAEWVEVVGLRCRQHFRRRRLDRNFDVPC